MFAERASRVSPFLAVETYEKALAMERAGINVVHLEIGEPDMTTPPAICAAATEAMTQGRTHYTNSQGDPELREGLAAFYAKRYHVTVDPGRILCFSGTSPALFLLFSALLNDGDEVLLSDPYYPAYVSCTRFAGGKTVFVPTLEEDGFRLDPEAVRARITSRSKALVINSPCNPTGVLLEPARMRALAELGPLVLSDEIYHGLTYSDETEHTILEYTDNAVVVSGFSKTYAMTGWRLGYLIVPQAMVPTLRTLTQHFFVCASSLIQRAGLAALTQVGAETETMRRQYDERRKLLLAGLRELGFGIKVEPRGAFYILANAAHLGHDSCKLATDILEKAHVAVTPGKDFGSRAEGFLRFSYANSQENIREGLRRLKAYIEARA